MKLQQWRVGEITLHARRPAANPFLDLELWGEFTGPGGEVLKLMGFWDGDDCYRIHFAPTRIGTWRYRTWSTNSDPGLASEGSMECIPYDGDLELYRHGFPRVGAEGQYLVYDDGTPFFWLADTHWTFVTEERLNESNCPRFESQFKAVVDRRAAQRFTVYQCNFRDGKDFFAFGRYLEYLLETENGLLPNLELLHENVDPKMAYLADAGFVIAAGYSWGGAILAENRLERYKLLAKYLVARYGAYPMIWTLAGEIPGYNPEDMTRMEALWREVALETRKYDGYRHLLTAHCATNEPRTDTYFDEPWFDFVMTQSGHGDFRIDSDLYKDFIAAHPGKPFVEAECMYDGIQSNEAYAPRYVTPLIVRRPAYLCFQSGGCGYSYGANGVWELQYEADTGAWGETWGSMAWYDGLELPGGDCMRILRDFYESVGWWKLRPIDEKITLYGGFSSIEAPSTFNSVELRMRATPAFTADAEMRTVVGYYKPTCRNRVKIRGLTAGSYTAKWFDPANGESALISCDVRPEDGAWMAPSKPGGREDRLLVLTANS